jgi:hypothetical protein
MLYAERGIALTTMIAFMLIVAIVIYLSKQGKRWDLRRLVALDAMEEAVGRAVELGKGVHFALGSHYGEPGSPGQAQAFPLLRYTATMCAERNCKLIASTGRGDIFPILESIVREGAVAAGKPEWFNLEDCRFLGNDQFACSANLFDILQNENIATNFVFGMHGGASILYFEAGRIADCIQIGGMSTQSGELGFFALGCDYFMVLGELVAAAAYISKDPTQLSTVAAQDYVNFALIALIIIGSILTTFGITFLNQIMVW